MNILMVCAGNTCRSVMAQYLLSGMNGGGHKVLSCGLKTEPGAGPDIVRRLVAPDVPADSFHRPAAASKELAAWADAVLVMTAAQKGEFIARFGAEGRVFLLTEYAGLSGDVPDPFGKSDLEYGRIFVLLKDCCERIHRKIYGGENNVRRA